MIPFIDSEVAYNNDIDGLHEKQAVSYDGFDLRSSLAGVQLRSVCTSEVQYHNEFLRVSTHFSVSGQLQPLYENSQKPLERERRS
jgi:hypothetical protein